MFRHQAADRHPCQRLAGGVGQRGAFGFGLLETFDPRDLKEAT